ncbi:MAG: hypothetical protein DRZ82_07225 [Thermoprotei archaeon]|nr:MAG: hypothetical protein DRZ82_07225 [Thermoprotei archaeon]
MPLRILIADPSKFSRLVLRGLIKSTDVGRNAEIIEAYDSDDAVRKYFQYNPHLIFLSISMPNNEGLKTIDKIRSKDPNAKVVVVSTLGREDLVEKALEKGALGYLIKPFRPNVLKEVLYNILGDEKYASKSSPRASSS